jgi:arginase
VSFDIDSINPELAPSTGVPVQGGINLQEMQTLALGLARSAQVKSVDIVEVNPKIGKEHEVFETYKVALLFLKQIFNPGGSHESIGRTNQAHNSAALESGSQI